VSEVTSGAVGELNPNIEGMIVDEEGREVKSEERGEFWVRGPNVMKGYWRKPEATAETKTVGRLFRRVWTMVTARDGSWRSCVLITCALTGRWVVKDGRHCIHVPRRGYCVDIHCRSKEGEMI